MFTTLKRKCNSFRKVVEGVCDILEPDFSRHHVAFFKDDLLQPDIERVEIIRVETFLS